MPRDPGTPVVADGDRVVLIGTSGVRWQDVSRTATPTLWAMVRDGATVGGVTPGATGAARRCGSAGWLALSAGRTPATGSVQDGTWTCVPWAVESDGGSARIQGWADLVDVQARSEFRPRLGLLGDTLAGAGVCATAVGPGAALALADRDGSLTRYLDIDDAVADPAVTFDCPVTVVDAGGSPHDDSVLDHGVALRAVDATVRDVLRAAPDDAVVLVVDVGAPTGRPWLGTGLISSPRTTSTFLSASSTRWEGVVRLLDVPTTVLAAAGVPDPPELSGSPLAGAGHRPSDVTATVGQLSQLTERDHALRGVAGSVTSLPMMAGLLLLGLAAGLRVRAPRRPATDRPGGRVVEAALLGLGAMPAGLFLMTTAGWWHHGRTGMWAALIGLTVTVALVAAVVPRRPVWAGPAVLGGLTGAVLTLDALLGTPLHRGSPLGPAPTLGGRYYGFGNPTYSVYVVAMVVVTAAVATWLLSRGRRRAAVAATVGLGTVALVVDLWPTLGADIGGGLVLVPAWAVLVLAVAGISVTWGRLLLTGVIGVLVVGAIGAIDWLRPAGDRTHLGRFVESLTDGTAVELIVRKAGYAAASVTSGPTAWLTMAVVVVAALLVWRRSPIRLAWFEDLDRHWPLARPTVLALLVAAVGGALVNDYGVRIATVMLFAAVPLFGLLALRLPAAEAPGDDPGHEPAEEPATDTRAAALPCEGSSQERSM